jgi:hypothetical protein
MSGSWEADMVMTRAELTSSLQNEVRILLQRDGYVRLLDGMTDADLRASIEMFGDSASRGSHLVNMVLSGCAAYRTQLFLYLKACGREELSTWDLWAGVDAPATV